MACGTMRSDAMREPKKAILTRKNKNKNKTPTEWIVVGLVLTDKGIMEDLN